MAEGGCVGCTQKIREQNAQSEQIIQEAQERANNEGQWYAVYTDEYGATRIIRADLAQGYPVTRYVSPKL